MTRVTIKYIGYDEYNKKKYKNEPKYSYTYKGVPGGWYFLILFSVHFFY